MNGRPLRFAGIVMAGWAAMRVAMLWPDGPVAAVVAALAPKLRATPVAAIPARAEPVVRRRTATPRPPRAVAGPPPDPRRIALALAALVPIGPEQVADDPAPDPADAAGPPGIPPPLAPAPRPAPPARWSGSAWGIVRGGSDAALAGGQLGGSQAGVRIGHALDADRRIAAVARAAAPLSGRGQEVALGIEWRPVDAPVRLVAERRWAVDGGRGGGAVIAVAGLPPTSVGRLTLEAYGQAGAVHRRGGFADGAARLTVRDRAPRPLRLDLGVGAWGGAQRGAARLDLGPTIGMAVPVGGRRVRLTLDWRARVAGGARPGSGPALSIGSDF